MAQKPVLGKGLASLLPGAGSQMQPPVFMATPEVSRAIGSINSETGTAPLMGVGATAVNQIKVEAANVPEVANKDRHPGISYATIDEILVNPYQPRREFDDSTVEELSASIRANGIIQPLIVRRTGKGYELIAGERRLRAAKKAGLKQVPIVIRKSTDRESLELALVENIQRENLNCVDEAMAYSQLMQDFSLTQEEVATRVGKERATVANFLRLLKLPEAIIDDLKKSIISFGHGKAILSLEDNDLRLYARAQVVTKKLSVRETEALVDQLKKKAVPSHDADGANAGGQSADPIQARLDKISVDLARKWGTKIEIRGGDRKGKIVFQYKTRVELDRLLDLLQS